MTSQFICSEAIFETESGKGVPMKPDDNVIQFEDPIKNLGKSIWACDHESSDNPIAIIFPQIKVNETEKFIKKIKGTVFNPDKDLSKNVWMYLIGDANGIACVTLETE